VVSKSMLWFFARDHRPPLDHEYQLLLSTEAGRLTIERSVAFLTRAREVTTARGGCATMPALCGRERRGSFLPTVFLSSIKRRRP
jgi:hypothetical protein